MFWWIQWVRHTLRQKVLDTFTAWAKIVEVSRMVSRGFTVKLLLLYNIGSPLTRVNRRSLDLCRGRGSVLDHVPASPFDFVHSGYRTYSCLVSFASLDRCCKEIVRLHCTSQLPCSICFLADVTNIPFVVGGVSRSAGVL